MNWFNRDAPAIFSACLDLFYLSTLCVLADSEVSVYCPKHFAGRMSVILSLPVVAFLTAYPSLIWVHREPAAPVSVRRFCWGAFFLSLAAFFASPVLSIVLESP